MRGLFGIIKLKLKLKNPKFSKRSNFFKTTSSDNRVFSYSSFRVQNN